MQAQKFIEFSSLKEAEETEETLKVNWQEQKVEKNLDKREILLINLVNWSS